MQLRVESDVHVPSPSATCVFVNHPLELRVFLDAPTRNILSSVPLHVQLVYTTGDITIPGSSSPLEILVGSAVEVWPGGTAATIKYRITETCGRHVAVVISGMKDGNIDARIRSASSNPVKVVQFKLAVSELVGTDGDGRWYKDHDGGKGSELCAKLTLLDGNGKISKPPQEIPLLCKLVYSTGQEVKKDLLVMNPNSSQSIDKNGMGEIKFRIKDLSQNHQNNTFCLDIGPTRSWHKCVQVASVLSPPVTVESKAPTVTPSPVHPALPPSPAIVSSDTTNHDSATRRSSRRPHSSADRSPEAMVLK
jgi:hypothetical protein